MMKSKPKIVDSSGDISDCDLVVLDETGSESSEGNSIELSLADEDETGDIILLDDYDGPPCKREQNSEIQMDTEERSIKKELSELKKENRKLREEIARIVGVESIKLSDGTKSAVVQVHFYDIEFAKKCKQEVEKFLSQLLLKYRDESQSGNTDAASSIDPPPPFFIDNNSTPPGRHFVELPSYNTDFNEVLLSEVKTPRKVEEVIQKPQQTCFNCLGDHMLPECTVPQDRVRIAQNRKEHYAKFGGRQSRYHFDLDPRFTKFSPGTISDELRKALNIEPHHLPPYIYKMRVLGYPPGWLMESQVVSSGIAVYDAEGKAVIDTLEEGEVSEPNSSKVQYDATKLVDYPGFNVSVEPGTIDDWKRLGYPPMQQQHQKKVFELFMKAPETKPFRRKRRWEPDNKNQETTSKTEDMELEENSPEKSYKKNSSSSVDNPNESSTSTPSPLDSSTPTTSFSGKKPRTNAEISASASRSSSRDSPPLEDLEKQKQLLLSQLEQQDNSSSSSLPSATTPAAPATPGTPSSQEGIPKLTRSASKSVTLGTPILPSASPYNYLPHSDKFSVGITEHMNFENLPNATGHFKKFKGVLNKVRATMEKQNP